MASQSPLFRLLTPLLQTFRRNAVPLITNPIHLPQSATSARTFSTSLPTQARGKSGKGPKTDPRITLIRYHLQHPKTPRPLRLSRMRALRHWTIHRAWMLARRKRVEKQEGELYRMYQSMESACEQLRNLDPPGSKDAGRLYRIAMEKKGIFKHGGVPIEYARHQVETPGNEAWNHGWTR
ncbi:hypothetical protein BP5796_00164 [Coleophoma crateriformis]|uniref:Large ribosomal subunit protein mL40 n=1 Tax=Coleophoma crateriformis TaxID=565419 RepID=A0A3D8T7I6_9HELO|nr:hypothetical protein BP5796_00164 [Coleophoma crateriformis]